MYVTSGGLSFVDIIYTGEFYAKRGHTELFYVEFDIPYNKPGLFAHKYEYEILEIDTIPDNLINQLNVIRDSLYVDEEEIAKELKDRGTSSKIDINKRLFYEVLYNDGSICKVNNQPRRTRVHFYCDQYRNEKD